MEIRFGWRPEKAQRNLQKHGVKFETAQRVFLDPFRLIIDDCEDATGELRFHAIGRVENELTLLVVFVDRADDDEEVIHIISARRANAYEKQLYADQFA